RPRNWQNAGGPRTPLDRSDGCASPYRSVGAAAAGCSGGGSRRPGPPARKRGRTPVRGHTAAAGWETGRPPAAPPGTRGSSHGATGDRVAVRGIQGGVLEGPSPGDLHVLHLDLNRLARFRLFEELHLAGF